MNEPRVHYETNDLSDRRQPEQPRRAVRMTVSPDWARVLHRQQQLLNQNAEGVHLRIFRDEHGWVRIEPQ